MLFFVFYGYYIVIVLDTIQDGYYKDVQNSVSMEFIDKVFNGELEVE